MLALRYRFPVTRRSSPRVEFSKLLLMGAAILASGVTVYACILMWHISDTSGLAYLIPAAYAELATATGFYYYKARAENEIKLRKVYGDKLADSDDLSTSQGGIHDK